MKNNGKKSRKLACSSAFLVAAAALGTTCPVWALGAAPATRAGMWSEALPAGLQPVVTARLKQIRGRFLSGGQVVYFGVYLSTQWNDYAAHLDIGVNDPGTSNQTVAVNEGVDNSTAPITTGSGMIDNVPPVDGVHGVGQSVQVAGQGNSVHNALDVSTIVGNPTTTIQSNCSSSCTRGPFTVSGQGIGLSISRANGEAVSQLIDPGSIIQSAQIKTNLNTVANLLKLNVYVSSASSAVLGTQELIGALKGFP